MRTVGRFIGAYGKRVKNSNIFGKTESLMGVARDALARRGGTLQTAKRLGIRSGAAGALGVGALAFTSYKLANFKNGLVKGMYPGSVMPMESGRFGIRTSSTPAGIGGVRFHFRRS